MFVLLVVAIMMVFGTFLQSQISVFYHDSFVSQMNIAFSDELTAQLKSAAKSDTAVDKLKTLMDTYSGRLGINTNRNYYILDKSTGEFLTGSESYVTLEKSKNIISAMAGKVGDTASANQPYLDYAYPEGEYIIYVKDTKEEMLQLVHNVLAIIAKAALIGIVISLFLGFIMSKTITRPIVDLTTKAEGLAAGNFDVNIEVKSNDEIGQLAKTFNYMSSMIKRSVDEIAQEKNKLETVFRFVNDGIIAFNTNQTVMHINPTAKNMLGITDESQITFDSFFEKIGVKISMTEILYLDHYSTIERNIDYEGKHFKAYFAIFTTDNERPSNGVVVALQDVTVSQNLDLSRREFVANVSHELRTPLTTIKSYAETLYDGAKDPDEKKFLSVISREVDRMTRIVKELLTLSSLDHNKLTIMKTEFSLDALIQDVVTKLSMDARKRNQKITYRPTTKIPNIYADIDRIEQVLTNVISNSIKYTPDGGKIDVFAGFVYNEAYIKIHDNGIGIPKKDLNKIFDRFYRVDKARSRENGGTGLGLSIAQEIMKLHDGSMKVTSEYQKWTEVLIKIPKGKPEGKKKG